MDLPNHIQLCSEIVICDSTGFLNYTLVNNFDGNYQFGLHRDYYIEDDRRRSTLLLDIPRPYVTALTVINRVYGCTRPVPPEFIIDNTKETNGLRTDKDPRIIVHLPNEKIREIGIDIDIDIDIENFFMRIQNLFEFINNAKVEQLSIFGSIVRTDIGFLIAMPIVRNPIALYSNLTNYDQIEVPIELHIDTFIEADGAFDNLKSLYRQQRIKAKYKPHKGYKQVEIHVPKNVYTVLVREVNKNTKRLYYINAAAQYVINNWLE